MNWNKIKTPVFLVLIIVATVAAFFISYNRETGSFRIKLGLDLKSGSRITIKLIPVVDPITGKLRKISKSIMDQTMAVLTRRLNPQGIKEVVIQPEGIDRIVIEIPEETNVRKAVNLIKQTAYLEFKETYFDPVEKKQKWREVMDGTAIKVATPEIHMGKPVVEFALHKNAIQEFAKITERNKDKPLGIYFDGNLIDAPTVSETIPNGRGVISGGKMNLEACRDLAVLLNAGALPVKVEVLESMTVSPTLGHESLMKSLIAMMIGMGLVMLFMIWYYRIPGFMANFALIVYAVVVMASMVIGRFVLTLPGIAGFILSIGMAVDANVLIFERTREELWTDKSLKRSVEQGFQRAFSSIIDGHVTTFIGAFILYYFGSSTIKGFGLTLMLGTFWSVITAVFVTRVFLDIMVNNNVLTENKKYYGA
ncbi:MAG: protein translocase subunit SecD [Candidatus Eremiobacteraeota bacterium]|nr:protein translocase subunit SecD [Candidatus Eremiobacteraeota bacterium]